MLLKGAVSKRMHKKLTLNHQGKMLKKMLLFLPMQFTKSREIEVIDSVTHWIPKILPKSVSQKSIIDQ